MPAYDRSRVRDARRIPARLKIAGVLLLLAALLEFIGVHFNSKPYLTAAPSTRRASERYSRMWFDLADDLVGAREQDSRLVIERWPGTNAAGTWRFDVPANALWTMAADSSRVAWISGQTLHSQSTAGGNGIEIALDHQPIAASMTSNASITVVFDDFWVGRWDAATGSLLDKWQGPVPSERAAAEGDYLAFASIEDASLRVFALQNKRWTQVQRSLLPELPERIVIPAPSVAGTLADGRLRVAGITRSSPGAIRSVAAHNYDVIAAGDFDGIYVLPQEGEYYRLGDAGRGSVVAAGETHAAVSGPEGATLLALGSENRLTPTGRNFSFGGLGVLLLALIIAAGPLLLRAISMAFERRERQVQQRGVPGTLTPPPVELINACASGRLILWAGAGLSAQSGFPLRNAFIRTLLESAILEFASAAQARRLRTLYQSGTPEGALNELASAASHRGALISHFTAIYARFAAPSRAHELLAELNLDSAITTNYDVLLDQTRAAWAQNIRTLESSSLGGRCLLKLYGLLSEPAGVRLSRAEFESALSRPSSALVRELVAARPVLFLGCSLEGLLADLAWMGAPEDGVREMRFAIAGVSAGWEKTANELARKHGIRVLACSEDRIGAALAPFLQVLARGVSERMKGELRAASNA